MAQAVTHGKQTGKNDLSARPNRFGQTYKPYFLTGGLPGFTLPTMFPFILGFFFFTDFLFEVFSLICLYFRLPPFLRLSVRRIR